MTRLSRGSHARREDGVCAMEEAARLAGEPHSATPDAVCQVIAAAVRAANDRMPDDARSDLLVPLLPRLLGTRLPNSRQGKAGRRIRARYAADFAPPGPGPGEFIRVAAATAVGARWENGGPKDESDWRYAAAATAHLIAADPRAAVVLIEGLIALEIVRGGAGE